MTDIFKDLPRLTWRGIEVPVSHRSVNFEQELAHHKYAYRDGQLIESLGRHNWKFQYTIPFREDITKGPYKNLYVATFSTFLQACRDNSAGELQDPVLGVYMARCESVSVETDVNRRDGEDLQVTFVHSPDADEIEATGAAASGLLGAVQQKYDLSSYLSYFVTPDLPLAEDLKDLLPGVGTDALSLISGYGARAVAYVDQVDAALADYEFKVDKIIGVLEKIDNKINNPQNMPVIRTALRVKDAVQRARFKNATLGRTILSQVTNNDSTASALANAFGMSLQDFLLINSGLPMPLVPAGTTIFYFQPKFYSSLQQTI